jgi:PAS domain S-box-containing protein
VTVFTMTDPALLEVLARSPAMLARADPAGRLLFVNPAWAAALGRDPAAFAGTDLADHAHPDDRDGLRDALARAGMAEVHGAEHRFAHADGSWRVLCLRARRATAGDGLHLAAQDVTSDRVMRDMLAREIDALTSSLAHDLRAPLRAIDGFASVLLSDRAGELPAETRRFLDLVRKAGSDVADLLDDLLAVVRIVREPFEPRDDVDLAQLASEVVELILGPRQGDREVTWVIGELPPCRCDPRLTRRLLEALLDNALKFTAPHATARIEVAYDDAAGAYLVRDDGVGFDDARIDHAYGIFHRLHAPEAFPGNGAGLAVATRVVERHGGRLWGRSRPSGGATFWFTLEPCGAAP